MIIYKLTDLQAFKAMRLFCEAYYEKTNASDIGLLLSDTALDTFIGGPTETADPAAWYNWDKFVNKILEEKKDNHDRTLTDLQAFNVMRIFLEKFQKEISSDEIALVLADIKFLEDGKTVDPEVWNLWIKCIKQILEEK